jgi:hypothetical protein
MKNKTIYDKQEWPYVLTLLPSDLEESARRTNALVRCRNVPNAEALIRMALAYAVSDLSLKDVAAWASASDIAEITGPGLFYRLREAEKWLETLLAQTLQQDVHLRPKGLRLRVVDATVINGPGAMGTDFRAHVLSDPATGVIRTVELTDSSGGEGYRRYSVEAGEVVLGDRAYATARGIYSVRESNAHVVARLNPHTLRVCDESKQRISLLNKEKKVPKTGGVEFNIMIPIPPERKSKSHKTWSLAKAIAWVPARVVAARNREGNIIWVLTTLSSSELSCLDALELYRLRWQIELLFKRLKSLLHFDALPSRQGPTAKSWMLARLLAAALAQKLVQPTGPLSPWGYELRESGIHS